MRVLVLGSGGREHALADKLAASPQVDGVLCAPGNAGTARIAESVSLRIDEPEAVVAGAKAQGVDLVVVGPEAPLMAGVVDACESAGVAAFGPTRAAARLEGSKVFAKQFMARHGIPTAGWRSFRDPQQASAYLRETGTPWVVKADGLAAGKGVVVPEDVDAALGAVHQIMRERRFGEAGAQVVLEERLVGQEISYHVVTDGTRYVPLAAAQDHKQLQEGDRGPNTGGMGAYSPPPIVDEATERTILERVVEPTLDGLKADGIAFRGALFIGLMIVDSDPYVLEYNVRFGDPETQVLMARWQGDVVPLLAGAARGSLLGVEPKWQAPAALCVVIAASGYPGSYTRGTPISGLARIAELEGVKVYHAGTKLTGDATVTAGGRVLGVTAVGSSIDEAANRAYAAVDRIGFRGKQYRSDIAWRARTPRAVAAV